MNSLTRRAMLKTLGGTLATLPLSGLLQNAWAADEPPLRFLGIFTPQGTVIDNWRPQGTENNFTLSFANSILAALEPFKSKLLVLDGLDYRVLYEQTDTGHTGGICTFLSGTGSAGGRAQGPSLDYYLAQKIGNTTPYRSANLGVKTRWLVGDQTATISFDATGGRVFQEDSPTDIYTRFFSKFAGGAADVARSLEKKRSVLDFINKDLARLQKRVTGQERAKLDQHLTALRDIEARLNDVRACHAPNTPATMNYDRPSDAAIPDICKAQMDLLTQIFACNLSRVATLQFLSAGDHATMPWLSFDVSNYGLGPGVLPNPHGDIGHSCSVDSDKGRRAIVDMVKIQQWYTTQIHYLLTALDSIPEGNGTVLDNTIILWGNELGDPATHSNMNVPLVVAGGGGKFRMGRYLKYSTTTRPDCVGNVCSAQTAHNHVLVSILQAFGIEENTFGSTAYTGPLAGLT